MATTRTKKRATVKGTVGADVRVSKRIRLGSNKICSSSSCSTASSSSLKTSNYKKCPTKTLEMPNGETIETTKTFPGHIEMVPSRHWNTATFDLVYPRLRLLPSQLTYTWAYEKCPDKPGGFRPTCWPNTPEDTIVKKLFLHPAYRQITWSGPWAEAKLQAEIARYDRVKWFWLFNDGWAYFHGLDNKHRYVARRFRREMESPWVMAWLGELIGEGEVAKILDYMVKEE